MLTKMKQNNSRANERFPCKSPKCFVSLNTLGKELDKDAFSGQIMNLSLGGMGLRLTVQTLEEGVILLIKMPLSLAPVTVPSIAQVKWIKEEKPGTFQAGLQYLIR
jgi:hypothetical protein